MMNAARNIECCGPTPLLVTDPASAESATMARARRQPDDERHAPKAAPGRRSLKGLSGRESGQTLVVAIIIMGLMLIMGFVFTGILSHNINISGLFLNRSQANDLSEAGIRYAHEQMLGSDLGADWRGQPTPMIDFNPGAPSDFTNDPDALYIRPPASAAGQVLAWPGTNQPDEGGPDGLGPFFRVNFQNGRALIRVRWAPTDPNVFNGQPAGALRAPGSARNYIILESVGRQGVLNPRDPTTIGIVTGTNQNKGIPIQPIQYRHFADATAFQQSLSTMQAEQASFGSVQVIRAFLPIGIIETSRYITNKYHQSLPAEIGVLGNMGANYRGIDVASTDLPTQMGTSLPLLTLSNTGANVPTNPLPTGGSLFSNADLMLHGNVVTDLNFTLGDGWYVAGNISGEGNLSINESAWNAASQTWTTSALGGGPVNSKSPTYNSYLGLVRDGSSNPDVSGVARGVGRKDPPSAESVDPVTGVNRYLEMTRDSGPLVGTGSSGRFGFGQGIYVNNTSDVQEGSDPTARANAGGAGSLINDWLNPSNATGSYWDGFFYAPPGAYVQLLSDGFVITRNPNAPAAEQYWLNPDGSNPAAPSPTVRYRLGRGSDGKLHILSGVATANINGNLGQTDFDGGAQFNGVIYLEGNARVRGVIPTDLQLTIVSNATIYVEGSITKGINGNQWTATYGATDGVPPVSVGAALTRPSKSMLMLIAKDYLCLNTTQFWGPSNGQTLRPKLDVSNLPSFNPVILPAATGSNIFLQADFPYDPVGQPGDGTVASSPNTWKPYLAGYVQAGTSSKITSSILIAHTMDDGPASRSFVEIDLNAGSPLPAGSSSPYLFPIVNPPFSNIAQQFEAGNNIRDYGMGLDTFQTYGNFESIALPFINPAQLTIGTGYVTSTGATGNYSVFDQSLNQVRFQPGSFVNQATNDYLLGRFAIVPADIRIEASMFAEEGSFFVIPGPWFNPNPNDTYANYLSAQGTQAPAAGPSAALDAARRAAFGASPQMPFYGEPIDARIVISGAVSENMPPPASVQAEWQRKWGWIPEYLGATTQVLPAQHVPANWTLGAGNPWVPNIIIQYDPVLATGRRFGFVDPSSTGNLNDPGTYVRSEYIDYNMDGTFEPNELVPLPPLPRLPVSPTLAYFGEVH